MIIVFTGNGKGKTTAAIGQAVRALGRGKRVLVIQFIKNLETGEHLFFKKIPAALKSKIKIIPAGKGFVKILGDKLPFSEHKKAAQNALRLAKKEILSGKWGLVILDEINVATSIKLIKEKDVLNVLPRKALPVVILTGRGAPKSFIKKADLVTEMKEIKHPFNKGAKAQVGVEF
ncbi:MAG: cob(I)yrinic acid a,c-diamide adenosyltransferase [Candidatus Paceibacterota bacterium]